MNGKKVLIVEDNPDDAALTVRAIHRVYPSAGIDHVHDGQEAVDWLLDSTKDASQYPDLVFLDIKLPRLNGMEVLRRIRADDRTCLVPIVMLTSSDEQPDIVACYREGVNSYLKKPVDFEEFMERIGGAAKYWLGSNMTPAVLRIRY